MSYDEVRKVRIIYRNWKGVVSERVVIPLEYQHKESKWHGDGKHHILHALDVEKGENRDFLLRDMILFDCDHIGEKFRKSIVFQHNSRLNNKL